MRQHQRRKQHLLQKHLLQRPKQRLLLKHLLKRLKLRQQHLPPKHLQQRPPLKHPLRPLRQHLPPHQQHPLQTLCEYGVFGTGLLLACTLWLVIPAVRNLVRLAAHAAPAPGIEAARLKRIPPVAVATGIALGGAVVLSLFGMPFRNC